LAEVWFAYFKGTGTLPVYTLLFRICHWVL
jgi:hypothetical protein